MNRLELHELESIDHIINPEEYNQLDLHSSALEVFTDFTKVKPLVVDGDTSAIDVEKLMKKTHVKLKFVLNSDSDFIGILSYDDLSSEKMIQLVATGIPRGEIQVSDLMRERRLIKAVRYSDLSMTSVGNVIGTLQKNGLQHCLVVDTNLHSIRGVISSSDIARKLHLPIPIHKQPSFVEIFNIINVS